jgi:hypothetical protein
VAGAKGARVPQEAIRGSRRSIRRFHRFSQIFLGVNLCNPRNLRMISCKSMPEKGLSPYAPGPEKSGGAGGILLDAELRVRYDNKQTE